MCLSLAAGILASNSASALAAEPAKSVKTDYDLLADMVSERYYLDEELAKIGMSLDEIFALPKMDDGFYSEVEALTADAMPVLPDTYAEDPTIKTLEAKRLAYAGKMAQWSVAQKAGRNEEQEVVYMYLSHYIDVPYPLAASNGIDYNSEDGPFAKYICQYDRDTYDLYLSRGSAFQSARDIKDVVSTAITGPDGVKDAVGWIKGKKTVVNYITGSGETALTVENGASAFAAIKSAMFDSKTPEGIIEDVRNSLDPTYGDASKNMAKEIVGTVLDIATDSVTPVGLAVSAAGITIDLSTAIFDKANYLSMRSYFNFRWADRFDYWLYGTMS